MPHHVAIGYLHQIKNEINHNVFALLNEQLNSFDSFGSSTHALGKLVHFDFFNHLPSEPSSLNVATIKKHAFVISHQIISFFHSNASCHHRCLLIIIIHMND